MIWFISIACTLYLVLRYLNRIPVPDDVKLLSNPYGGSTLVTLKSAQDSNGVWRERSDYELLMWDSHWFLGLRVTLLARKLRFRAQVIGGHR